MLCASVMWLFLHASPPAAPIGGDHEESKAAEAYGQLSLSFEPGAERTGGKFDFTSAGRGWDLGVSSGGAELRLGSGNRSQRLGLGLIGAGPARAAGLEPLEGEVNRFIGNDPSKWRTHIPTYGRVRFEGVYPGIDVDWYGRQGKLEYDFRLAAGADPESISMRIRGADQLRLASNGDLLITASGETLRQRAPVAYQSLDGERQPVRSAYAIDGKTVSFDLGAYDHSRPLVIDPAVLIYSSYLGGSGNDTAHGITVDSEGAAYITGETNSVDFPLVNPEDNSPGGGDAYVTKVAPSGTELEYSTFFGGATGGEIGFGIDIDSSGNALIGGLTTSATDLPLVDAFDSSHAGGEDGFVAQLDSGGDDLLYSSYVGGTQRDHVRGIAYGTGGDFLATGFTESDAVTQGFPINGALAGYQSTFLGGPDDGFLIRLDPDQAIAADQLRYSTYLGGNNNDELFGVDADSSGNAYVTGVTSDSGVTDYPTTAGSAQPVHAGIQDTATSKVDTTVAGSAGGPTGNGGLVYSTFIGGSLFDGAQEISVASDGSAYLAGGTVSSNFPTTAGAVQTTQPGGGNDATLTVLNPAGSARAYSTYLGGATDIDTALGVAVDDDGDAYVAGRTASTDFPVTPGQSEQPGSIDPAPIEDTFLAKIHPAGGGFGDLVASTYLGGTGSDIPTSVAVDANHDAYVTGFTDSAGYWGFGGFDNNADTPNEVFIAKLGTAESIDGSPLNVSVTEAGRIQAAFDGEGFARFDAPSGLPRAGLTIDFVGPGIEGVFAAGGFGAADFHPINPSRLNVSGGTLTLTTVYRTSLTKELEITQTDTYVNGQTGFTTTYAIQNRMAGPVAYRSYVAADLVPGGEDIGVSDLDSASPRFLQGLSDPYQVGDGIQEADSWDAFQAGDYSAVAGAAGADDGPGLNNSVDTGTNDTSVAVQRDDRVASALSADDGNDNANSGDRETFSVRWEFDRVPPAIHGAKVVASNGGGAVLMRAPGQPNFTPLIDPRRIPLGTLIDARNGFVNLTSENGSGVDELGRFWEGLFEVQQGGGVADPLDARLSENLSCKGGKKGKKKKKGKKSAGPPASASASPSRHLWARAKGRFRTTGYRGSATVRGTEWRTEDRCAAGKRLTNFLSVDGLLEIDVFGKKGTVNKVLGPGKPFVAGKPKAKKKSKKK